MSYLIKLNNKEIYDFYKDNPALNFESMNLLLLKFIKEMGNDLTKTMNATTIGEILNTVRDLKSNMSLLSDQLSLKLHEHNRVFLDNTKLLMTATSSENTDKIIQLLNRNTDDFIDKITNTLPKTQQDNIQHLQKTIQDDLKNYLSRSNTESSNKDFLNSIESKILNLQQPIFSFIQTNNEHITQKLTVLNDDKNNNNKIMGDLSTYLNKYNHSSQFKGKVSEINLYDVLKKLYKEDNIIDSRREKQCADFILQRTGKNPILIENKNYEEHVKIEETGKFLRDCISQNMNGLMMSQHSGIVNKPNNFIEINNGKVLMYITFVDYDPDKIRCAVECIDNLSERIQELEKINALAGYNIDKQVLDQINDEYQKFSKHKDTTITNMKEAHKKMISYVEEFKMPNLAIYLNDKYASVQNCLFICKICNGPFGTCAGLSSHMKVHKEREKEQEQEREPPTPKISKASKASKTPKASNASKASKASSSKEIIINDDDENSSE